jgi:hypothetical protein
MGVVRSCPVPVHESGHKKTLIKSNKTKRVVRSEAKHIRAKREFHEVANAVPDRRKVRDHEI